ncbi:MAG: bifunctional phosphopantothenoylcysteine decarboxylase/phosphopantothenate--cysteine ligase CoaBC [Gammaproteobacteria bacterium]|jgi:phosphopantothenoylcysteine decarboxylase / phosphopantothenate---cysteine ligase|nr:bifunctional phosphopantothenoylcysteine decarboxylase/phosphopantothenate--cysteine ligase CoaBC [Gammaproteobacteria bacterium]
MQSLINKQVILGITGGIAAYKSAELCRLLIKAGANVRVVMTSAACEFITPLTMQALSGNRVHTELLDEEAEAAMGHIELARWADLIIVAPVSANFMARVANGEANDLLATICLAATAPIALAPAMNQAMWSNQNTQDNLTSLKLKDMQIFGPADGEQACGDIGLGRMLEPIEIIEQAAKLFKSGALAGLRVCITAGPTREAIDPVRYISNHSSGKMGYALAQAAVDAGAKVSLISGPVDLVAPPHVDLVNVESAEQMLNAATDSPCEIFIAVAAVADYRPQLISNKKIKKIKDSMQLKLVKNPDILATIAGQKSKPFCVGFAAETENLESNALKKLKNKKIDLIVANHATETFNNDEASVKAYWHNGDRALKPNKKEKIARELILIIKELI